jgi:hypothetical protein
VDARGQNRRAELFAPDRLGDAVARLYERYAELLPDGGARTRAAATARSVTALLGPPNGWRFAPDIEAIDHRGAVGYGSVRGADAVAAVFRALFDLMDDIVAHTEDVLGLRPDALLVRVTQSGTDRVSGGAFERHVCL